MKRAILVAACCLVAAGACVAGVTNNAALSRLPATTLPSASSSAIHDKTYLLIRDAGQWQRLWTELNRHRRPVPALPDIDFSRQMLLLAALGRRPSGGYEIRIESVTVNNRTIHVDAVIEEPGPGCLVTTGLTAPVDIVILATASGRLKVTETVRKPGCDQAFK